MLEWLFSWRPIPTALLFTAVPIMLYMSATENLALHISYALLVLAAGFRLLFGGCRWLGGQGHNDPAGGILTTLMFLATVLVSVVL